ncbi:porin family protein [Bacteroides sp.]|uniref:porin family protein n=1 Tax=Bacteroides sp. TaxID=29523 RepID=UPI003AB3BA33
MKLKVFFICFCLLATSATMWGQTPVVPGTADELHFKRSNEHPVNFGVKAGFTSSLFLVSQFSINDVAIDEVQNNYKIGYFASVFMRINFDRHFLQPEISYNINRCNITFEKPLPEGAPTGSIPEEASITSSIHSIDIPVIYGYNVIKEGPYSLAIFGGPKVRYIWDKKSDITFDNFDEWNIREKLRPLNLSFTAGVAVTISRIFFDFRYDIGLHNISKHVTYEVPSNDATMEESTDKIRFQRRDNVLSFSFGILF